MVQPLGASWILETSPFHKGLKVASIAVQAYLPFPLNSPLAVFLGLRFFVQGVSTPGCSSFPLWDETASLTLS